MIWTGRVISAVTVLFLVFDGAVKFTKLPAVAQANAQLGYPENLVPLIGMVELGCTALYAFPLTSLMGTVFLTAFLGGAVSAHLRVGDPLFSHILFPVYLGALAWIGIYLRDDRLRALLWMPRRK